ncbi:Hsp20/alpha crystallin family protein [Methanobrevibacter sp.]|uniref:Hsp20/alpha crystallin family protein n=1 Tax=Methanobrevibacter sp. TaxID=66852 RepID=UPI00388FFC33
MVEKDVLEEKMNERKERFDEKKEKVGEKVDSKYNEKKEKFDEKKEKGKVYSEKFVNDLNTTIDEFKDSLKNMQKYADDKINEYKNATISNLAVDLIESDDIYYLKVAVPGLDKDEVEIEAGDNDIVITATFKPFVEELKDAGILKADDDEESEDVAEAKVIASELTVGKCSKTVRFENSIEVEKITAKYKTGIILITIPKLIIPKHKVTVE